MLASLTKAHVRPLVELNDRINQLTSSEKGVNSTRIVVVGDQSHGKSSVLEALGAVDLPRGEDIKTRVPLIMQLRSSDNGKEYALISRKGEQPEEIELSAVAAKVDEFTEKIAGGRKSIIDEPIDLRVYKRDQDDLTLIDLPGITRVAREGQDGDGKQLEEKILKMCRKYCEPAESVILNVVSAMVDFSTSASLQLSQELDPHGARTLLCVTKIDQHKEPGLAKKLSVAIESMRLRAPHVFVVRNRKQQENDQAMPLSRVRDLESEYIQSNSEIVEGADTMGYGLGVGTLSKQLVRIQVERIIETLPEAAKAIRTRLAHLQGRMQDIGSPLPDEFSSRLLAMKMVDQCHDLFEKEREGRMANAAAAGAPTAQGEMFELELEIESLPRSRKETAKGDQIKSDVFELRGGLSCWLSVYPNGQKGKSASVTSSAAAAAPGAAPALPAFAAFAAGEPVFRDLSFGAAAPAPAPLPLGVYVNFELSKGLDSVTYDATVTLVDHSESGFNSGSSPTEPNVKSVEFSRITTGEGWGWKEFLLGATASKLTGAATVRASIYISNCKRAEDDDDAQLFCATLNEIDEDLVRDVNRAHPERTFFSKEFGLKLAAEARARRGSVGMPGSISQEVPVGILRGLRAKLPAIVDGHVQAVSHAAAAKIEAIVGSVVQNKAHPKFSKLLVSTTAALLAKQTQTAQSQCKMLLDFEDAEVITSNHYYMDMVQQLRKDILQDEQAEEVWAKKPAYLQGLDFSKLLKQSNEEQELVDMQIKTFAFWKVMKKRLVDYLQLAARHNLSVGVSKQLKPAFLEAIEKAGDPKALMASDEALARERLSLIKRIDNLEEADRLLKEAESSGVASVAGKSFAVYGSSPTPFGAKGQSPIAKESPT